ncbi:MBL fold metallo-hydrolase [Cellulomonas oligotrophica]|uniref:Glyoxylase-like metal-dependent hydrolase (Beta-lactamase superfamily II) n=1 Tax=Cellulomonas oligotrophica TaxID=931536 RepID=A0A7Y9FIQ0_9CELL|nr:MBL fold metallo-hydrolase [Cellulomonas oligotrophica]NYD87883.1 glyoxylase-like metal-dependent hydrolase (beta-lactamase superfamily II) [Cellulomonas oligotrophica]GIG32910.1 MBL fold metallo-hydrolase [Cellulomonas oligotrophica]
MRLLRVADGVLVASSRTMSTTSTLLVTGGRGVLVDPAWWPDELSGIADDLDALDVRVTAGFSTHAHHDHLLWHPRFGAAPRWASTGTCAVATRDRAALLADLTAEGPWPADLVERFGDVRPLPGGSASPQGGAGGSGGAGTVLRVPEPFGADGPDEDLLAVVHDAHAPGHAALWAPARGVLLVGDMLSDVEVPLPFDPDDVPAYLAGLDALAPWVARADVLVPGHGAPTHDPVARLDADRRYLDAVLGGRTPDDPRLADPAARADHARLIAIVAGS